MSIVVYRVDNKWLFFKFRINIVYYNIIFCAWNAPDLLIQLAKLFLIGYKIGSWENTNMHIPLDVKMFANSPSTHEIDKHTKIILLWGKFPRICSGDKINQELGTHFNGDMREWTSKREGLVIKRLAEIARKFFHSVFSRILHANIIYLWCCWLLLEIVDHLGMWWPRIVPFSINVPLK